MYRKPRISSVLCSQMFLYKTAPTPTENSDNALLNFLRRLHCLLVLVLPTGALAFAVFSTEYKPMEVMTSSRASRAEPRCCVRRLTAVSDAGPGLVRMAHPTGLFIVVDRAGLMVLFSSDLALTGVTARYAR
jgi:hypothetical protein